MRLGTYMIFARKFMSMARSGCTVALLSCRSSGHAERLPSNADTTIWQVCLKCTLTFISSCTGAGKLTFLQFTLSQSRFLYYFDHFIVPNPERVRKQVRNLFLSHGGFLKRCMFVSSLKNWNTLLLHWFQKIRQNLSYKETYVTLGKAASIVFEA